MLADQGYACGMCLVPFKDGQRIHIDHDHSLGCHPGEKQACDRCRRGLLCHRCNIATGWVEACQDQVSAYVARAGLRRISAQAAPRRLQARGAAAYVRSGWA